MGNINSKDCGSGIEYAIDIVGLQKRFKRVTVNHAGGYTTLKSSLLSSLFARKVKGEARYTDAVKNLTMRIPQGASVGVIGRNGSGKSTLLKLITGIYKPDAGKIAVNGRVAALIELGAGFHPDFTGRENLFLGGVMHGLSRKEIKERFDEIVDFAELRHVIDDPIRTYSSGMFMRLGFSLAIHTDPDVLLIDEVLAVGDAAFITKCKDRITQLRSDGKTLMLVTHDLAAVERWCDEVLWLDQGEVKDRGEPRRVLDHYRQFVEKGEELELMTGDRRAATKLDNASSDSQDQVNLEIDSEAMLEKKERWGSREIEITSVRLLSGDSVGVLFHPDDTLNIEINYIKHAEVPEVAFGIGIKRSDGLHIYGTNTDIEQIKIQSLKDSGTVKCRIKRLGLLDGKYSLDVAVHAPDGYPYDYHVAAVGFVVRSKYKEIGVYVPEHTWEI